MRQTEIENKFIEIEKRLTLLEGMFDLKPVEIGKKYEEEPKIIPFSQQEEKKDKDEVQNDSLSGATNLEQGKTINTEQMPVKEDNHPPADIKGIEIDPKIIEMTKPQYQKENKKPGRPKKVKDE